MLNQIVSSEKPLSQDIADRISQHIISSGLKPGDKLPNESELCRTLGVSRGTVREAIKILSSRNIVSISRGIGTFVAENTGVLDDPLGFSFVEDKQKLVLDLLQLRNMIEPELVRLAAENANEAEIKNLIAIENKLEDNFRNNKDHIDAEIEFHTAIARCSHNHVVEIIFPLLTRTIPEIARYTKSTLMDATLEDHRAIIRAIGNHNSENAERLMRQHLERNTQYVIKNTEQETAGKT